MYGGTLRLTKGKAFNQPCFFSTISVQCLFEGGASAAGMHCVAFGSGHAVGSHVALIVGSPSYWQPGEKVRLSTFSLRPCMHLPSPLDFSFFACFRDQQAVCRAGRSPALSRHTLPYYPGWCSRSITSFLRPLKEQVSLIPYRPYRQAISRDRSY